MKYSDATDKVGKYQVSGSVFADTVRYLGHELDAGTEETWLDTMAGLATADELAELDPNGVTTEGLVSWLGLTQINEGVLQNIDGLIGANIGARCATTIREHYQHRDLEAHSVSEILRWLTPDDVSHQTGLWYQMSKIAQAGIHLDSLADAPEDADSFEQFTASELAIGAAKNFIRASSQISPRAWTATLRASRKHGLDNYLLITKPLKMAKAALLPTTA